MLRITYYRVANRRSSFHCVARQQIRHLRKLCHEVVEADLVFDRRFCDRKATPETPVAIVYPLFFQPAWHGVTFEEIMASLRQRHRVVIGMEVADSTSISPRFVSWANHRGIDGLMLPSKFSVQAFKDSGVTTPAGCVPYGITRATPSSRFDYLRQDPRPKFLFFARHDPRRKGWDLVRDLTPEFPNCLFVIKGPHLTGIARFLKGSTRFFKGKNILAVDRWLDVKDLASLYVNCDGFISLHRGGAFELNCAEALAYGLPVVATRFGSILEYLDDRNAYLVDTASQEQLYPKDYDHSGLGGTADLETARRKINEVLQDLEGSRKRARRKGESLTRNMTWDQSAQKIYEFIKPYTERI